VRRIPMSSLNRLLADESADSVADGCGGESAATSEVRKFTTPTVTDAQLDVVHRELSRCCSRRGYAEYRADELIDGLMRVRH
jgi:hypothetical protein